MKQLIVLFIFILTEMTGTFAQFTFIHLSDLHISAVPAANSDTSGQYFQCALAEFAGFNPKPAFVIVTGDVSDIGNVPPNGMYPSVTQHLFPHGLTNPAAGDLFIDSARTIPIYFTPGNHEYWTGFDSIHIPISGDTLFYYPKFIFPDADFALTKDNAVIVFLRSGHDTPYGYPPNPDLIQGTGLSDAQCSWLRSVLSAHGGKRKIIVMHHPPVNAAGTNSDGTPFTALALDTATNSLSTNRTRFLDLCDSNHVDLVLAGHEHQNVAANRKGDTIDENLTTGTRYIQTAAAFNRSYRIITVDPGFVSVSRPMRSCNGYYGVPGPDRLSGIRVFPNPAGDRVTVECPRQASIELSTAEGKVISRVTAGERLTILDLTGCSRGIYIIKIGTAAGTVARKLIKF